MTKEVGKTHMRVLVPDALKADLVREQRERIAQGRTELSLANLLVLRAIGTTLSLAQLQERQRLEKHDGQVSQ